jgi:hypothetical protein
MSKNHVEFIGFSTEKYMVDNNIKAANFNDRKPFFPIDKVVLKFKINHSYEHFLYIPKVFSDKDYSKNGIIGRHSEHRFKNIVIIDNAKFDWFTILEGLRYTKYRFFISMSGYSDEPGSYYVPYVYLSDMMLAIQFEDLNDAVIFKLTVPVVF